MTTKVAGTEYKSTIDFALTDSRATFGNAKVFTFVEVTEYSNVVT